MDLQGSGGSAMDMVTGLVGCAVLCCAVVVSGDGEGPRTKRIEGLSVEIEGAEAQTGFKGTV